MTLLPWLRAKSIAAGRPYRHRHAVVREQDGATGAPQAGRVTSVRPSRSLSATRPQPSDPGEGFDRRTWRIPRSCRRHALYHLTTADPRSETTTAAEATKLPPSSSLRAMDEQVKCRHSRANDPNRSHRNSVRHDAPFLGCHLFQGDPSFAAPDQPYCSRRAHCACGRLVRSSLDRHHVIPAGRGALGLAPGLDVVFAGDPISDNWPLAASKLFSTFIFNYNALTSNEAWGMHPVPMDKRRANSAAGRNGA